MNYLGIVIALVILLYIVYRVYRKSNNYAVVLNAYFAKYTYDRLTKDQQEKVQEQTEDLRRRVGGGMPLSNYG